MAEADPGIFETIAPIAEATCGDAGELDAFLRTADRPLVLRGLAANWDLVEAGRKSDVAARQYLLDRNRDLVFTVSVGSPDSGGRLFYDDDMQMNFRTLQAKLPEIFAKIEANESAGESFPIYLASIDTNQFFSGLAQANRIDLGDRSYLSSIWIGNRTRIAAHNDFPDNLACVAVGHRRFTLFPPDQFRNLYLGPVDNTPAGRAISMVDFHHPDFATHPRFRLALEHAQTAELGPGDAIFIPSMWWHHIEGLSLFNILVNYWWRDTPRWLGQPQDALNHALMSIRDLPDKEKRHWRDLFDYYVFENGDDVTAHIPEKGRSVLAPLTPDAAARIRNFLLRQLSQ